MFRPLEAIFRLHKTELEERDIKYKIGGKYSHLNVRSLLNAQQDLQFIESYNL